MDFRNKRWTRLTEILAALFVLLNIILVSVFFSKLPDLIPNHYNFQGLPTDLKAKKTIWLLPVFSCLLYLILSGIAFFVKQVTRPDELSVEVTRIVRRLLRQMKLILTMVMLYLASGTILLGLGKIDRLSVIFSPLQMILLATVLIVNISMLVRRQFPRKSS